MRHLWCRLRGFGTSTVTVRIDPNPYDIVRVERAWVETYCDRCGKRLR